MTEDLKAVADATAGGVGFGAFVGILPEISAVLSILWLLTRLYEWSRVRLFRLTPPPKGND